MKTAGALILSGLVMAGCVSSGGTTKSCVTEIRNADGSTSKVIAHVDASDPVSGGLCEGDYASVEDVTAAMFGKPAPAKTPAPAPKAVLSTPARVTVAAPLLATTVGATPHCRKTMIGGTGYGCIAD